jgi:hypothetical protein
MFRETSFGDVEHIKRYRLAGEEASPGRAGDRGRNACGGQLVVVNRAGGIPPVTAGRPADVLTGLRFSSPNTPGRRRGG